MKKFQPAWISRPDRAQKTETDTAHARHRHHPAVDLHRVKPVRRGRAGRARRGAGRHVLKLSTAARHRRNCLDCECGLQPRRGADVHHDGGTAAARRRHRTHVRRARQMGRAYPRRPDAHQHRRLRAVRRHFGLVGSHCRHHRHGVDSEYGQVRLQPHPCSSAASPPAAPSAY